MRTARPIFAMPVAAAITLLAGCSEPLEDTPETALPKLMGIIAENLPKGWQIGNARESGVEFTPPTRPEDVLVWKTEKVVLRKKGVLSEEPSAAVPVHVYFTLMPRPFIKVDEYPGIYETNKTIKATHDYWLKTVSHIPKNAKTGEPMPRGDEESVQVRKFREVYPTLPPYDPDLPTHHYGSLAFKLRDWRTVQEPEDRKAQTEMNTAFVAITKALTLYRH